MKKKDSRPNLVTEEFVDRYAIKLAGKDDKHSCQVIITEMLDSLSVFVRGVRGGKTQQIDYPMFQQPQNTKRNGLRNERKDDGIFRNS